MLRCYTVTGSRIEKNNLVIQVDSQLYSYIEVTTVTAHKELMFFNISKVLNYTLITNCTLISEYLHI